MRRIVEKLKKAFLVAMAAGMVSVPMSAMAAPRLMPDGQVFDANYYAANNPDVVAALGTSEAAMYQHYQTFGKNEGRLPCAPAPTGAEVTQKLLALQSVFPEGMKWGNDKTYTNPIAAPGVRFAGCASFAMEVSDMVYGALTPMQELHPATCAELQPGDIVRVFGNTHSVVVISVDDKCVTVCEGNYNGAVHWNGKYARSVLDGDMAYVWRRVPAGSTASANNAVAATAAK